MAEMNPESFECDDTGYSLCFRPLGGTVELPRTYACKYLRVTIEEVKAVGAKKMVTSSLAEELDAELTALSRLEEQE